MVPIPIPVPASVPPHPPQQQYLSNITIFGTKLTDIFTWDNIKSTGYNFGTWFINFVTGIPLWAYGFGWLVVVGLL